MLEKRDYQNRPSSEGAHSKRPAGDGPGVGGPSGVGPPSISLPKGGGAIRGIGEKFGVNLVTGTGAMTVPLATSPARSGFGPQLSLTYDSGAGNGPFGFGWSLSLPTITRKTDKGLPKYWDAAESDTFVLSGAEDLVPVLQPEDNATAPGYTIRRYRPRLEGLFARIERWTSTTGEVHWRSVSRDNITTLYGHTAESRIADPDNPGRVFSWLICQSHDYKGNVMVYRYEEENSNGVDLSQANERNRTVISRSANRYLKRICYGNVASHLIQHDLETAQWMFEVVFDYDEGHYEELALDPVRPEAGQHRLVRASASPAESWRARPDPFSSQRAGFEIRTYRRCRRVLMFHHFAELGSEPCLVHSTEFEYADLDYSQPGTIESELAHQGSSRFASFICSITKSGFVRDGAEAVIDGPRTWYTYLKKSLPPLEFEYSKAVIQDEIRELDADSLENLPVGLDGSTYQWIDLDGEGVAGMLTEQAGAWFYKSNLGEGRFGRPEVVKSKPSLANLSSGRQQLIDLAGDGQLDLVAFAGALPGFYARTCDEDWKPFKTFAVLPNIRWDDPNMRFVDLNGDGHADVLITETEVLTWYPSLAEEGFDSARYVPKTFDEEGGPRLVLADGTQSIYLADMCGDGLTDLVRIRNGEICYWPNLGYGRFGGKVTMDNAPWFDRPDQFSHQRVRVADIDGSGASDIIYLGYEDVRVYFNQSGNRWSEPHRLKQFPRVDNLSSVTTADLLGNGTGCLVWSSPLPAAAHRPLHYIDLMGGQKPHLLIKTVNNLGAETLVGYASSTRFYLADKARGSPWITRIPFPVHTVERVEIFDRISRNHFVTRYAYHHGYFDGAEREFRGFGLVEQWDTEEFASLRAGGASPVSTNVDEASHIPPVLTRTWFHTGAYLDGERISRQFEKEYYREPGLSDLDANEMLLDDSLLPEGLSGEEEREAVRALKGSMLRQEVYARDGTNKEEHPYTVTEQNFAIKLVQPKSLNRHAVFFTHPLEAISYHYERNPADPRLSHALTLDVDEFGNVLKSAAIGYGRRPRIRVADGLGEIHETPNPGLNQLDPIDQTKQTSTLVTYTENRYTTAIVAADDYRTPLPCESRTYELSGYSPSGAAGRFQISDLVRRGPTGQLTHVFDSEIPYERLPDSGRQRRLIEHVRTLYRRNDLSGSLPLGTTGSLALPFESYKLAFTPELVPQVYGRRVDDAALAAAGYVHSEGDGNRWIPSGQIFYTANADDAARQELDTARQHFFLPCRFRDPFGHDTIVTYDSHDLLIRETRDALANEVIADNDYRVLQPRIVTDPNGNRSQVTFDILGMVAASALMGKLSERQGDLLTASFNSDPTRAEIDAFSTNPEGSAADLLGSASTRIVYDLERYRLTASSPNPEPPFAAAIVRETHVSDLDSRVPSKVQISFSYSDGFGREIQKKIPSEPGPLFEEGGPAIHPRWVGSGWTIFNNKGKPVRQYEPFFTNTHRFEFAVIVGVSPVLFYDPVGRVVGTLHPNHTYDKVAFDSWRQETWDMNDTVLESDPNRDRDLGAFFQRLPSADYLPTWYARREAGTSGRTEQDAARATAAHSGTPTVAHLDSLGRTFLTIADNGTAADDTHALYPTRVELDIEGNQRSITDARGNRVMEYGYDMLGTKICERSMDAGDHFILNNVASHPIRAWDSRGHTIVTMHDELQRPKEVFVSTGAGDEKLAERTVYGEPRPGDPAADAEAKRLNLRGRVRQHYDGAGVVTNEAFDFKGNLLSSTRQFAGEHRQQLDWSVLPSTSVEAPFTSSTSYDALNRPITLTMPDRSVIRPAYNKANLLESVRVNLRGAASETVFVSNIDYDAKGQRKSIEYGNNEGSGTPTVRTEYRYDPLTFRIIGVTTRRTSDAVVLQDLSYTYDPVGNITAIRDDAQQTIYFRNRRVEPSAEYAYDALYRLTSATGREHLGQNASGRLNPPQQINHDDSFRANLLHSGDGNAMGNYTERYVYDAVGNILRMIHEAEAAGSWTRRYSYAADSNRLLRTSLPGDRDGSYSAPYEYNEHGSMISMPHLPAISAELPAMEWDFKEQLHKVRTQRVVNGENGETVYYVYDAAGQRARKVIERPGGSIKEERLYVGGFEVYREYSSGRVTLQRETLHIMDGERRIAMVETRTIDADVPRLVPTPLIRYQLGNHLGSSSLELDEAGEIISYEEYFPYGSTSYRAVRGDLEVSPKRYRYTGKERDEETGFYYHGARYYAPWLGRWTSADPAGMVDGTNLYCYARNNSVKLIDPSGTQSNGTSSQRFSEPQLDGSAQSATALRLPIPNIQLSHPPFPEPRPLGFASSGIALTQPTGNLTQDITNQIQDRIHLLPQVVHPDPQHSERTVTLSSPALRPIPESPAEHPDVQAPTAPRASWLVRMGSAIVGLGRAIGAGISAAGSAIGRAIVGAGRAIGAGLYAAGSAIGRAVVGAGRAIGARLYAAGSAVSSFLNLKFSVGASLFGTIGNIRRGNIPMELSPPSDSQGQINQATREASHQTRESLHLNPVEVSGGMATVRDFLRNPAAAGMRLTVESMLPTRPHEPAGHDRPSTAAAEALGIVDAAIRKGFR
jgi:RHS repeat-associated protein